MMTRVALNYMQQGRALTEMASLRPGGFLFCRVERIWHDFALIARSPSPAALICRCRDFGYGVIHSLAGLQPTPGTTLRGGRAFATARRLSRILNSLGCHVVRSWKAQMVRRSWVIGPSLSWLRKGAGGGPANPGAPIARAWHTRR